MDTLTIKDIIVAAGGCKVVAERLELTPAAVSMWRNNGIPTRYWAELARAAEEHGRDEVTIERIRNADAGVRSLGSA